MFFRSFGLDEDPAALGDDKRTSNTNAFGMDDDLGSLLVLVPLYM